MNKRLCLGAVILLLAGLLFLAGCSDHKDFVIKEEEFHLSFEYPIGYRIVDNQTMSDAHSESHILTLKLETKATDQLNPYIEFVKIYPNPRDNPNPSAKSLLEYRLSLASKTGGYQLLERDTLTILGTKGERILYTIPRLNPPAAQPEVLTRREIFSISMIKLGPSP